MLCRFAQLALEDIHARIVTVGSSAQAASSLGSILPRPERILCNRRFIVWQPVFVQPRCIRRRAWAIVLRCTFVDVLVT